VHKKLNKNKTDYKVTSKIFLKKYTQNRYRRVKALFQDKKLK